MDNAVRVMVERGKKKRTVASAFDWSGWDRSGNIEEDALLVLESYRPRYAKVAELAGLSDEFGATAELAVVERLEGTGMTDFYGLSGRSAGPEQDQMTEAECERKLALLRAAWTYFDDVAARVSNELRKGPRGGGRDRDAIIQHVNGSEIVEFAKKVGVRSSPDGVPSGLRHLRTGPGPPSPTRGRACARRSDGSGIGPSTTTPPRPRGRWSRESPHKTRRDGRAARRGPARHYGRARLVSRRLARINGPKMMLRRPDWLVQALTDCHHLAYRPWMFRESATIWRQRRVLSGHDAGT